MRTIEHLDYSRLEPADGVLFLYPQVEIRFHPVAAFLAAGGRAAVVDDYGSAESLLERFHIHRANAPSTPALRLRNNAQLPVAVPAPSESAPSEPNDHPTLRGVSQLVTNHPTALRLEAGIELTNLLLIPARGEPDALLAVTGVIGDARACGLSARSPADVVVAGRCGRLLAMADPSAFINLMLRHPGNRDFARGLVSYLLEDDAWGRRGGNLYIVHGRFGQSGSFGGEASLQESLHEQRAALLAWLSEVSRDGLPEPLSIGLAALLALGVAIWAGLASGQPYVPSLPVHALATPLGNQGGFAGRFAVLSLASGDRALPLLELKRSLEAKLAAQFGLPSGANAGDILRAAVVAKREPRSIAALEDLFRRLSAAEVAVLAARRLSVSDRELADLHRRVLDILSEMQHDEGESDRSAQH